MRKINKPLGWVPKDGQIVNKEEPAKAKRKTKDKAPEPVVEQEPVAEVAPVEAVAEVAEELPAEPTF